MSDDVKEFDRIFGTDSNRDEDLCSSQNANNPMEVNRSNENQFANQNKIKLFKKKSLLKNKYPKREENLKIDSQS
jgi:hypothetical protein